MTESIHYILKDDVSEGLLSIRDKTVLLDKATQTLKDDYRKLEKELGELTKAQRAWEKALESSGKKSSKATQEYEKFLEAAGGEDASAAVERQRELQQELEQTQELLRKTRKEAENLNKAGGEGISLTEKASGEQSIGGKWQFLEMLGRAGVLNPLASAAGGLANEALSSALGEQTGTMASSILGGAALGITMGMATGNPLGILTGGVVGAVSGLLNGVTKNFEKKDDAFKEYYADLHDTVRANTTESLSRGKTLAAAKETEEAAALAEQMRQRGAPEKEITAVLTGTYQAAWDRLEESKSTADTAYGTGYNEKRKAGIEAEQAAYDGELGAALGELNEITGSNQAYLDNLAEQYTREALSAVLLGEETTVYDQETANALREMGAQYAALSEVHDSGDTTEEEKAEAGLKMQSLKEQAEAMAKAAYESSEQYQLVVETEQEQIAAIRENTKALDGWRNSMALGEEKTKGLAENFTIVENLTPEEAAENEEHMQKLKDLDLLAVGLKYVPYDNFPAMLHQGERVLTAEEARQADRGGGSVQVTVTGNEFHVRRDSDIDAIASAIADRLEERALLYGG